MLIKIGGRLVGDNFSHASLGMGSYGLANGTIQADGQFVLHAPEFKPTLPDQAPAGQNRSSPAPAAWAKPDCSRLTAQSLEECCLRIGVFRKTTYNVVMRRAMKTTGTLLDAAALRKFTTLLPGRNVCHVLVDYLCVALLHGVAIFIFEHWRNWGRPAGVLFPVVAITVLLTGAIIHRIALIGHESSHYLLLRNRRWNEIMADLLCFFPLWGSLVNYRRKHTGHHSLSEPGRQGSQPGHSGSGEALRQLSDAPALLDL